MEPRRNRRADQTAFHTRDAERAKLLKGLGDFAGAWRQQLGRQIVVRKGIGSPNTRMENLG